MSDIVALKKYVSAPSIKERIDEVLQDRAQQFIVTLLSTANSNTALAKCEPASVLNAAMTAAMLDLPINQNLGFAYIIPYKDKAQFQMGYKGFVQLAMRSNEFKTINVTDVRDGELKKIDRETGKLKFKWLDDAERKDLEVIGYVAHMELKNGFKKSLFMTRSELDKHASRYSKSYTSTNGGTNIWRENFDSMAKKTVVKQLLSKWAPLSTAMQKAQTLDQAVINGEDDYQYVDNQPITAAEIAKDKERQKLLLHIKSSETLDDLEVCEEFIPEGDEEVHAAYNARYTELEGAVA